MTETLDLFAAAPRSLDDERRKADVAGERAADRADRVDSSFRERAQQAIVAFAKQRGVGVPFFIAEVRLASAIAGSGEDRAWAAPQRSALAQGYIRHVDIVPSKFATHAGLRSRWAWTGKV